MNKDIDRCVCVQIFLFCCHFSFLSTCKVTETRALANMLGQPPPQKKNPTWLCVNAELFSFLCAVKPPLISCSNVTSALVLMRTLLLPSQRVDMHTRLISQSMVPLSLWSLRYLLCWLEYILFSTRYQTKLLSLISNTVYHTKLFMDLFLNSPISDLGSCVA